MPVFSVTFEIPTRGAAAVRDARLVLNDSLKALFTRLPAEECFICSGGGIITVFAVSEQRKEFYDLVCIFFQKQFGLSKKQLQTCCLRFEGPDAMARFFYAAVGMNAAKLQGSSVQQFRTWFEHAREAGGVGPYLTRLYQRGVWLAEKIRIESNLHKRAVTPEGVVAELAAKIFGDLRDHSALIVAGGESTGFVQRLRDKNIGELFFAASGSDLHLDEQFPGEVITPERIPEILPSVDLVLLFDRAFEHHFSAVDMKKMMDKRKNAPLFYLTYFDRTDGRNNKNHVFAKFYNVYAYTKLDLDDMLASNLREHEKVVSMVEQLIEKEIDSFIQWVQSNERYRFGNIIGKSAAIQKIMELVARIAQTDISVLIDGESGTGKELIARAIHEHSRRQEQPFIVVNCGAIPESLLESELFGHAKGAFTGATRTQKGLFEAANHGTIFLDEIGETSPPMQVKLLRFLQEGEIKPVGSNETIHLDVRLLTATNRNLEEMVENDLFRQDLYYRLNVIQLTIPPLRERKDDIIPLAEHFIKKYSENMHKTILNLDEDAMAVLLGHVWKGNVRELENVIERAVALCPGKSITADDLPLAVVKPDHLTPAGPDDSGSLTLKDVEKRHIEATLQQNDWDYDLVTKLLGIGRTTLWRKMKEYEIPSGHKKQNARTEST